jgi:hypothetical protein
MPQANKELRDKWGIDPSKAMDYLESMGWNCGPDNIWRSPPGRTKFEDDELSAVDYLFQEWDYAADWCN